MPQGANVISDGMVLLESPSRQGTGFFIRSKRRDGCQCMLTAHHVTDGAFVESMQRYGFRAYMKYLSGPDPADPRRDKQNSGYFSYIYPNLLAQSVGIADEGPDGDWSLFAVDTNQLPVITYRQLPFSFEPTAFSPALSREGFYIQGYPKGMALRILDSISTVTDPNRQYSNTDPNFAFENAPGRTIGSAGGASGGPIVKYSPQGTQVIGVHWGYDGSRSHDALIAAADIYPGDIQRRFAELESRLYSKRTFTATKLRTPSLKAAIIKHCWENDSVELERTQDYKRSVLIDNTQSILHFKEDHFASNSAELLASADRGYIPGNINTLLMRAQTFTINFGVQLTQKMLILAEKTLLEPGFSVTPTESLSFEVAGVIIEGLVQAASKVSTSDTEITRTTNAATPNNLLNVYPNPSISGIFNIKLPAGDEKCRVVVYSSDGKEVYSAFGISGTNYQIDLSELPRANYILNLYREQTGEKLFTITIVH